MSLKHSRKEDLKPGTDTNPWIGFVFSIGLQSQNFPKHLNNVAEKGAQTENFWEEVFNEQRQTPELGELLNYTRSFSSFPLECYKLKICSSLLIMSQKWGPRVEIFSCFLITLYGRGDWTEDRNSRMQKWKSCHSCPLFKIPAIFFPHFSHLIPYGNTGISKIVFCVLVKLRHVSEW